ncbi:proline racemase family protein [Pseudohalocynthiibacter sp. F2068]|jgi:proline racemase|uniref:proline racemase family protein n=1 Tax=Pseudohalocynthiibacter sp. F2068 TaxID=2926418 RepID=UPI001FF2D189|nr:proline racemase family protein [Pseudohalocynthiibacter sp. F2068]MCK0104428.1 proline racemase family protein [Pseudohalocynthiibacter sp. F2068]
MRWKKTLQVVDVHCEGEVGRVVQALGIDPRGATIAEKIQQINNVDDSLRRLIMREPRGFAASHGVLLTHPTVPEADFGLIILATTKATAMSGSNVMCATTALLETGTVKMEEPYSFITFDTASGLVRATARCRDGKVENVALKMPPAFVAHLDVKIATSAWGRVSFDIAFGGVFCAIFDVAQFGIKIERHSARALADLGIQLLSLVRNEYEIAHPIYPDINGVAYIMFRDKEEDGATRTCSILMPGRVDRSPCGTGSNANLATRHARGLTEVGEMHVSRSIIDGEFQAVLDETILLGSQKAIGATITGRCWIHAISQMGLDPSDPFPEGFILSDTWGPASGQLDP